MMGFRLILICSKQPREVDPGSTPANKLTPLISLPPVRSTSTEYSFQIKHRATGYRVITPISTAHSSQLSRPLPGIHHSTFTRFHGWMRWDGQMDGWTDGWLYDVCRSRSRLTINRHNHDTFRQPPPSLLNCYLSRGFHPIIVINHPFHLSSLIVDS